MSATVTSTEPNRLTIQLDIELIGSFFEQEQAILNACNEAGRLATKKSLQGCDSDGSPIQANGGCKYTARTQSPKKYHTPFGCIELTRYVYQTSKGGKIYCPLEAKAHIIQGATPRMAQLLTGKYARLNAYETCDDLEVHHGVSVSRHYLQKVTDAVSAIAQAHEEDWTYDVPKLEDEVATLGFSLDGAMVLMRTGWREAMVGTFSLYNPAGERLHSIYLGATPEYGKKTFCQKYEAEAQKLIARYPHAKKVGIADGAADNWKILNPLTDLQVLDFYHVTEYLSESSMGAFPKKEDSDKRTQWLSEQCHRLKHEKKGAESILEELQRISRKRLGAHVKEKVKSAITYFENHLSMMNYCDYQKKQLPIGSGVVEAACKSLIKQRFCRSGMRWKEDGMKSVLSLRSLVLTKDRWVQFWDKINDHEFVRN